MCGIVGQINLTGEPVKPDVLKRMRDTLARRGPDDAGSYCEANIGLGFRRLSIIDISVSGRQPMSNEKDDIWLVFNGEFYNFQEYREELKKRGHIFKSRTDSEVIIHMYEEYGIDCLKMINGMFALAIYDKKKAKLYLARDRFGVKPLFYYSDQHKLIFASELKAILAGDDVKKELDNQSVVDYFSAGYIMPPFSIFKHCSKLPPASYLCFDTAKNKIVDVSKYWSLEFKVDEKTSINEWQERFEEDFKSAVKLRLISDVPLGIFLSGGLDSSSILAFASGLKTDKIKTFSIGLEESGYDETPYSTIASERFASQHFHEYIKPDMISLLPELVECIDEPMDDSSAMPSYYLSSFTRKEVKVALSGDGGDELLAGYRRYGDFLRYHAGLDFLPSGLRKWSFSLLENFARSGKNKRRMYLLGLPFIDSFQEHMANFTRKQTKELFAGDLAGAMTRVDFNDYLSSCTNDKISNLQILESHTYLPGDNLVKIDRTSMANSLEVRSPFLDYRLWESVFRMPVETRYRNGKGKLILKNSLKGYFDGDFINREKMGFSIPLDIWFRTKLQPFVKETLFSDTFRNRAYFDMDKVKSLVDSHISGVSDNSRKIWSLLFFEYWCRSWLDN